MDADLTHDVRLMLQLMQSSAELLATALDGSEAEARNYLKTLTEALIETKRMLCGETADMGARAVDVVECLRTLCRRCMPYAAERRVQLTFSTNVEALTARLDEDKLSRAALNLMMNALRFARREGAAAVTLTALGDYLEIAVRDDGPGILPERLPYIFLRGETEGGGGYGLPAALNCARRLGGSLTAASEPGRGATFTLRLPVSETMAS